ncbi:MAG: dihydroorotate dehydrogenase electron transfer subunit [Infirmifilum uzonense]|uniref:dihydroorotate dehydrogenase electron transfer subunit n=1 Tax=Infirmifilum uzonense TaxID=1550241 RepID=UPI003C779ACB
MHIPAEVVEAEHKGNNVILRLRVNLAVPSPGQFIMLWVPNIGEIPLSVADYEAGELLLAITRRGKVTGHIYENVKVGERLFVRGPYGKPFTLPPSGTRALLVAGGSGIAPIHFLAKRLAESHVNCTAVIGFKTLREALLVESFRRNCRTIVTTDDGTLGIKGLATEATERLLDYESFDRAYACGPEPLIEKALTLSSSKNIPFEASMERYMRCAVGVCGSCVLEPVGLRVCKDGPVFPDEVLKQIYHNNKKI